MRDDVLTEADQVIDEFLDEHLSEYVGDAFRKSDIPSGEGLSKREAQKLLIDTLNKEILQNNRYRISKRQMYVAPPLTGLRQINQAVFMARQKGGYEELLKNCGY